MTPPAGKVDAGLQGGLRDKFGAGSLSITEAQLNHSVRFTILGVKPDKGMKLPTTTLPEDGRYLVSSPRNSPTLRGSPIVTRNRRPARPSVAHAGPGAESPSRMQTRRLT